VGLENPIHLLVLAVIILLVFGSSKLPSMARSAGKHAREAKDGVASFKGEFDNAMGGEDNPINQVTDTLRAANPKNLVRDTVTKAASPTKKPPAAPPPAAPPPGTPPPAPPAS
jgi:sec-independent protein translocase protein TatA